MNIELSPHATKAIEYLIAISYLVLLVPFWRFVQGQSPAPAKAFKFGWFQVPDGFFLHAGHAWAKPLGTAVAVGLDDFAHRLIGRLDGIQLPDVGAPVRQGQKAFTVFAGGVPLDVLSPVDGHVVAVNDAARNESEDAARDPYGAGWVMKVEPRWLTANLKNLFTGDAARRFLDRVTESMAGRLRPELGLVLADGGTPVHGIAHEIDPERWDELVRQCLSGK